MFALWKKFLTLDTWKQLQADIITVHAFDNRSWRSNEFDYTALLPSPAGTSARARAMFVRILRMSQALCAPLINYVLFLRLFTSFALPLALLALPEFEACSISKVPFVVKIKREVITTLNVGHLFHWSIIISQRNPRAHWFVFPPSHEFENSVAIGIEL
jgi:hypothetical protein